MNDNRVVEVEVEPGPPCKECGAIGAHYCVGKNKGGGVTYIGKYNYGGKDRKKRK